jgi:shikimate dehydrogenase
MDPATIQLPNPLKLGLTGWPLEHSFSPYIHAAAFEAAHINGEYELYPIPPSTEGDEDLRGLLQKMSRGELHGLNVTIPHKETIIPLLDDLSATARAVGAVNTIVPRSGRLVGENTDAPAFMAVLENVGALPYVNDDRKALVLGAGGAARAVVFGLVRTGWQVTIAARRIEQGRELAARYADMSIKVIPFPTKGTAIDDDLTLIVNTTPLGMYPNNEMIPWPVDLPFPKYAFIYDLVYNPLTTSLVAAARRAGLGAETGMGMLVEQAALAWELWTFMPVPRAAMHQAVRHHLEIR